MPSTSILEPRPARTGRPGGARSGRLAGLFLPVVLTAQLMVVLDTTIVNVALPRIQHGLGFSGTSLSWVLNAYVLAFGGLLLLGARAGDLLGRRRTFLLGIALFSLGSLAGGFAPAAWMMLAARAVQGVGGALAAPSSLALLTSVFPEGRARVRAIGLFTTVSAAGGAVGLVAGGLLTEWASWRWVMFVNVPIGLAVWFAGRVALTETPTRHGRFDAIGAATSTAGMTGLVLALVEAGSAGWTAPVTVGSFVAGVALLGVFAWNERRADEPILPMRLLADRARSSANVARGLVYAGMYGVFFFLSQFLQNVDGYTPLRAGLSFLPIPLTVFAASQLTSKVLIGRVRAKSLMLGGTALVITSLLLASRLHAGASFGQVLVVLVLLGAGSGTSLVSLTSAALAGVEPSDAGAASGLTNVMQQLGAALGLAVLVTVFGAATDHASLGRVGAGHAVAATVHGLDVVFAVGAVFAAVAMALIAALIRTATPQCDDEPELEQVGAVDDELWSAA